MKKAVTVIFLLLPFLAGAQTLGSLCVPSGSEETAMGSFCRNRFDANRTMLSGSLWGLKSVGAKTASLEQTLNFGEWSFEAEGRAYLNKPYDVTSQDGRINGSYTPFDACASIGAGRKFFDAVFIGIAGRFCYSNLGKSYAGNTVCADILAEYYFQSGLVGLSLRNVGPKIRIGLHDNNLPTTLAAGGYWTKSGLKISGEADYLIADKCFMATVGASYTLLGVVSVLGGYHYASSFAPVPSYACAGLGVRFLGLELSGTCLFASETLNLTPCISLSYAW